MGFEPCFTYRPGDNVPPPPPASKSRQIIVRMPVAVGIAASIDDHRIMEQGFAVDVVVFAQLVEKHGELSDIPLVDISDFTNPVGTVAVMRKVVVSLDDADVVERPVAAVVREHQARDACRVGLECQYEQVVHQLDVLGVVGRNADRRIHGRVGDFAEAFHLFDPGFELANAGQVLVELVLVARLQATVHRAGLGENEVEDGPLLDAPALQIGVPLARRSAAEKALKDQPGIGFRRHGRRRRAPGELYWYAQA